MRIAVLGATGPTGTQLVRQALERGHAVVAVVREPTRLAEPPSPHLEVATVDVHDPDKLAKALVDVDVVVSGLGVAKGDRPGVLAAGAEAVASAHAADVTPRIVWLSAFGSGASATAAGPVWRNLMKLFIRSEMADKTTADDIILRLQGTSFHAGPLTTKPDTGTGRTVPLDEVPRRALPRTISRATVAAAMLDEAEIARHPGQVVVPLR